MKKVEDEIEKNGLTKDARMVLQVHDELVYEIKKEKLEIAKEIIEKMMVEAIPFEFIKDMNPVPLAVSVYSGVNWGELK
jgi:DNA polymerase-1